MSRVGSCTAQYIKTDPDLPSFQKSHSASRCRRTDRRWDCAGPRCRMIFCHLRRPTSVAVVKMYVSSLCGLDASSPACRLGCTPPKVTTSPSTRYACSTLRQAAFRWYIVKNGTSASLIFNTRIEVSTMRSGVGRRQEAVVTFFVPSYVPVGNAGATDVVSRTTGVPHQAKG